MRRSAIYVLSVVNLLLFFQTGCATEHIPTYPTFSPQEAMKILAARSRSIHTISAQGLITLTREDGDTVRLDAAIVLQPPGRARLRAWKFGQAVFDMTLTPDGLWLIAPPDSARRKEILSAGANTGNLTREWLTLMTGMFDSTGISIEESGKTLLLKQPRAEGAMMICEVDRKTLTPRRYGLKDSEGRERFTLSLSRYVDVSNAVWPKQIEAASVSGRIRIELRDIEINGELPPGAFKPPARAEKIEGHP